jgi:hypothetical protein
MRKLNCRAGDLAIIVEAFTSDNIGMIVRVLSRHRNQSACPADDVIWLVQAPQTMTYEKLGKITHRKKGPVSDSSLRPIRGYPLGKDIAVEFTESLEAKEGKLREFLVDESGTISDPVELRSTNADFYDLEDFQTIETLIDAIEFCPPLLNHFQQLAWEKKEELAETDKLHRALQDDDFGWRNWIIEEGQAGLVWFIEQVEVWLDDPAGEEALEQFSGVASAKRYFERFDYKTLDGIGVQIVEGQHPGSSYYAAVLRQDIDYVNNIARSLGLTFSFRQE